ncbi:NADH-ubiquinone oxidoreductase complex 1/LYR family protein [Gorgonomyces haynaldii]|nr:NADH-ubiquinone oxidoreductase complex 1/LYR family protein [Gorgonomyces haynaldii]
MPIQMPKCPQGCDMGIVKTSQFMDRRVRQLYKELLYYGREYPLGYNYFRNKLKQAFLKQQNLPSDQLDKALERGRFVIKELEALWFLKKYRTIKKNYEQ